MDDNIKTVVLSPPEIAALPRGQSADTPPGEGVRAWKVVNGGAFLRCRLITGVGVVRDWIIARRRL